MNKIVGRNVIIAPLVLILALLVSCVPAVTSAETILSSPTGSDVVEKSLPTITQTGTSTPARLPIVASSLTSAITSQPSATQSLNLLISATLAPTRTRTTQRQNTPTASKTPTFTPTATPMPPAATVTRCPIATAEPLYVEPVTSPTDQLTQIITVGIGNGESVTIITESGTFTTTNVHPAKVEITLYPDTVHHLQVIAKVRTVIVNGCVYGGYALQTTLDRQGNPLLIVQETQVPYP